MSADAALSHRSDPTPEVGRLGMWIFLATDLMGFGGLLVARAALEARGVGWRPTAGRLDLTMGLIATTVLLASGVTIGPLGAGASRDGRRARWRLRTGVTAGLGLAFLLLQAAEYARLLAEPHRPHGMSSLAADHGAALFYVLTGYHALHVAVGLMLLLGLLVGRKDRPPAPSAMANIALYWQFVDVVWVVLFPILYLGGAAGAVGVVVAAPAGYVTTRLGREHVGTRLMMATTAALCLAIVLVLTLEYGVRAASAGGPSL